MGANGPLDLVVFGATGYTGRLVCEQLRTRHPTGDQVGWAIAGRSSEKLDALRTELGLDPSIETVVADTSDQASIESLAGRTRAVLSTVGPYQLYGSGLVEACVNAGTDYVDLCGEPTWMKEMIDRHQDAARESGARIVFACGFDSVPFDLGVHVLQQSAIERFGQPLPRVKARIRSLRGSGSGGSIATFATTMAAIGDHPEFIGVMADPFALAEGAAGPPQPSGQERVYEEEFGGWSGPFMMSVINTKVVHRSNFLSAGVYGDDFVYDEMILLGPEPGDDTGDMTVDPSLQPGEGPSKAEREAGFYDIVFVGTNDDGETLSASVSADLDPGYGSTSKIVAEAALCLLDVPGPGGLFTPATAMGDHLVGQLRTHGDVTIQLEDLT